MVMRDPLDFPLTMLMNSTKSSFGWKTILMFKSQTLLRKMQQMLPKNQLMVFQGAMIRRIFIVATVLTSTMIRIVPGNNTAREIASISNMRRSGLGWIIKQWMREIMDIMEEMVFMIGIVVGTKTRAIADIIMREIKVMGILIVIITWD